MSEAIIIALITGGVMLIGNIITAYYQNQKTIYRIEQLERKQDKYNNLQERVLAAEKDIKHIFYEIDEIKEARNDAESKRFLRTSYLDGEKP